MRSYARGLQPGAKGWAICCPFHEDSSPSCTVFFDTGVFHCLSGCGAKSPREGLQKLGATVLEIDNVTTSDRARLLVSSLPELNEVDDDFLKPDPEDKRKFGVLEEEDWPSWDYREIRAETLTSSSSRAHQLFAPKLTRLWVAQRNPKFRRERFPRLSLRRPEGAIHLRLATKDKVRCREENGLKTKAAVPFGLPSYDLGKTKFLFVGEGGYDWLRTYQNLEDLGVAEQFSLVSLLGIDQWASFYKKMELNLAEQMRDRILIIAADNDKGGKKLEASVTASTKQGLILKESQVRFLRYAGKDPGDLARGGLLQALKKAKVV